MIGNVMQKKNKENIYNWDAATKLAFYVATGTGDEFRGDTNIHTCKRQDF